jgi:hypothetical protein
MTAMRLRLRGNCFGFASHKTLTFKLQKPHDKILKLELHHAFMANHGAKYLREATQVFLFNSSFKTPAEAVEAGVRSVSEWCDCLNQTRVFYGLNEGSNHQTRKSAFGESEMVA